MLDISTVIPPVRRVDRHGSRPPLKPRRFTIVSDEAVEEPNVISEESVGQTRRVP